MLINAKSLANAVAGSTLVFDGNGWVAAPPTPAASVGVTVQLYYNGVGPIDIPAYSLPDGWNGTSIAALGVTLTTGDDAISGLEDAFGNPIPDGWTFPATVFVEDTTIYDIIAINPFVYGYGSGIVWWNESGGMPGLVLNSNTIIAPNLPTSDPDTPGALWSDRGTVVISGAIAPGAVITPTSGSYAMTGAEQVVLAEGQVTLPSPSEFSGISYTIKDNGSGTASVAPNDAETIDGSGGLTAAEAYDSWVVASDGANWWVLSQVSSTIV